MLKIYGVPMSVHTRKVIVAAIEKDLAYEIVPVAPVIPSSLPEHWPRLSPTGKIPVLADGDLTLADSTVICAYLDRTYPAHLMYPAADTDYIHALWIEEYADGTMFREVVHPLFHHTFVRPHVTKEKADPAVVESVCNHAVPRVFGYLERVVGDGWLAGATFSVADVAIVSNLVTYQYVGFPLEKPRYPKLSAFFERAVRHPSVSKALRAEQPVVDSMGLRRDFLEPLLA